MRQALEHHTCPRSRRDIRLVLVVLGCVLCFILACAVIPVSAQNMDAIRKDQGRESLVPGKDQRTGDRVIMISPSRDNEDSTMIIHREPDTGDLVIHLAPPQEQKQDPDVHIGPLFISPEITWPDRRKPLKQR